MTHRDTTGGMTDGDRVIDADGRLWTVLNPPCELPGAESPGLFRAETPGGGQCYGTELPRPLYVYPAEDLP